MIPPLQSSLERRPEASVRADLADAYEAIASRDEHAELIRDILVEVTLLADKYRNVRRHDVPHVAELAGLLDVLWQEVEMVRATPQGLLGVRGPSSR